MVKSVGSISQVPDVPCAESVVAVKPMRFTCSPEVSIKPPLPLTPVACAERWPEMVTWPDISAVLAPPIRWMLPPSPVAESALMLPDILMTLRTAPFTTAACNCTLPPLTTIVPELSTRAEFPVTSALGTATCMKFPPLRSSATCSPEPIASRPKGTVIVPELPTAPPSNAT